MRIERRRVKQLTYEEALALASVFGKLTAHKTLLLWLFREPSTRYDVMKWRLKRIPIRYRMYGSSVYRLVDWLLKMELLRVRKKKKVVTLNKGKTPDEYELAYPKGILALPICAYLLYSNPKISDDLKKKMNLAESAEIVNAPRWRPFLYFLQWHQERRINLSHATIDPLYYTLVSILAMIDRRDELGEEDFEVVSDMLHELGLGPENTRISYPELYNLRLRAYSTYDNMFASARALLASTRQANT